MSGSNALGTNPTPAGLDSPDFELFTMDADGSRMRQITFNELDDEDPVWSPDGRRLSSELVAERPEDLLQSIREEQLAIYTMRSDGSDQTEASDEVPDAFGSASSPDGRFIAHTSFADPDNLHDRSARRRRAQPDDDSPASDLSPDWQPLPRKGH